MGGKNDLIIKRKVEDLTAGVRCLTGYHKKLLNFFTLYETILCIFDTSYSTHFAIFLLPFLSSNCCWNILGSN